MLIRIEPVNSENKNIFNKIINKFANQAPLMKSIAAQLADAVEENFAQQGRPRWLQLSRKTINKRARKRHWGPQAKILQDTGALAASISTRSDDNTAIAGTNLVYAPVHQFGGDILIGARQERFKRQRYVRTKKKGRFKKMKSYKIGAGVSFKSYVIHIPARPFLSLTPDDISAIRSNIISHLT